MKNWSLYWTFWTILGLSQSVEISENEVSDIELKENAENVCIDQEVQNKILNITYIQSIDVKEYTWCLKIPPKCVTYRTKLVTRWKEENTTRVVNVRSCCPGYQNNGKGYCKPICEQSCGTHGHCAQPNICSCEPGFSGEQCQDVGCPGGKWGPDCSKDCPCKNGGRCEPHTGKCLCPPGWKGVHCQNQCGADSYGLECTQKCQCAVGQRCHHVSGECLPCSPGTFGPKCAKKCECSKNGTALCLHTTGQCFCHPNWYGNTCELHCPFGYVDDICHIIPINGPSPCICTNDQMICDHIKGCICKENGDCGGGQRLLDLTRASPLDQDSGERMSHSSTVAIVLSVLFLTLVTVILIVIYYKCRMNRMKKDLANRSVYYVENSILDQSRHQNHDLVITDQDPIENTLENNGLTDPTIRIFQNNVPNNVASASTSKAEKNINIDRFKLGMDESSTPAGEGAGACAGACAAPSSDEELEPIEIPEKKNQDINVFEDDSPSKEKNNFLLDNSRKINKPTVDLVFHRNNLTENLTENEETDADDEVTIAKMTAFVNQKSS